MAYTQEQKSADNVIRSLNRQIEKAYRELGYNHNVTRNLVSIARSTFGVNNMREMKINAGYSTSQIDVTTGEIHSIPQIKRNAATLTKKNADAIIKATRFKNNSPNRPDRDKYNGTYSRLFSVTMARENAINKVLQASKAQLPQHIKEALRNANSISDKNDIISAYEKSQLTEVNIMRQIQYDDLMGELFEQYHQTRNEFVDAGIDDYEDNDYFQRMQRAVEAYNDGTFTDATLISAIQARDEFLLSSGYTADELASINALPDDTDLFRNF